MKEYGSVEIEGLGSVTIICKETLNIGRKLLDLCEERMLFGEKEDKEADIDQELEKMKREKIKTNEDMLTLLATAIDTAEPVTIAEIARRVSIHRKSFREYLEYMVESGWVVKKKKGIREPGVTGRGTIHCSMTPDGRIRFGIAEKIKE